MCVGDNIGLLLLLVLLTHKYVLNSSGSNIDGIKMSEIRLNRPHSVEFNTKDFRNSKLSNQEVLQAASQTVPKEDIRGVQLTLQGCIITLKSSDSHDRLKAEGFSLRTRHISVTDVDQSITNVTLKDAPVEMPA